MPVEQSLKIVHLNSKHKGELSSRASPSIHMSIKYQSNGSRCYRHASKRQFLQKMLLPSLEPMAMKLISASLRNTPLIYLSCM